MTWLTKQNSRHNKSSLAFEAEQIETDDSNAGEQQRQTDCVSSRRSRPHTTHTRTGTVTVAWYCDPICVFDKRGHTYMNAHTRASNLQQYVWTQERDDGYDDVRNQHNANAQPSGTNVRCHNNVFKTWTSHSLRLSASLFRFYVFAIGTFWF